MRHSASKEQELQPTPVAVLIMRQQAGQQRLLSSLLYVHSASHMCACAPLSLFTHVTVTTLTHTSCPRSTASLAELRRAELMLDT
jgi:hypothetical protein